MASTLLCLVIFVVAGTLLDETSALLGKRLKILKKRDIWDEAVSAWTDAKGEVRFNLAPSYGTLDLQSLQQLDEALKVMMGGILELDVDKGLTWKELRYALDTNPLMLRQPELSAFKLERITFKSLRFFGLGSDKSYRSKHIYTWFSTLIGNVDILKDTDIDLDAIAKMVSKINVDMVNNLWTSKSKKKNLMDLGILRFPDIDNPFFALYRINLLGKCTYQTYILHQKETSDIVGLFQREVYYPDRDYIRHLSGDFIEQLLSEVDDLFSDM